MGDCGDVKKVFVATGDSSEKEVQNQPIKGILITDKAAEKIRLFLENDQKSTVEYGLYVAVKKDGCSGYSYNMALNTIAASREAGDKIFEKDGSHVMIDKTSYFYVIGSQLDYIEALTGSGFTLGNPNVKTVCSCGSSFAV